MDQGGFKLRDLPDFTFQVLGLKVYAPLPDKREGLTWPRLAITKDNLELLIFVSIFNPMG